MNGQNGVAEARLARFTGTKVTENRYELLKARREAERRIAIKEGLIPDPNRRTTLEEAFNLVGICEDMCPEFEREQRDHQRAVDKWEINPATNRIDPQRAVKTFHRPAAGDETPLPSDVRPPHVLKSTLDYLIHNLLASNSLEATHNFIRDRTRSIRQDFTLQHESGPLAIECHERIARLHILSLHEMRGVKDYTEHLEMEQVRKVLQSLIEFYDDARLTSSPTPNQAEFRAYHLLAHIRDPEVARQLERQSPDILDTPIVQIALDLHAVAQRNNVANSRRAANTEAAQNLFSRFFQLTARSKTPFLVACLLEFHFEDIRKGALKAMKSSFREMHKAFPIDTLTDMLGFNDDFDTAAFVQACKLEAVFDHITGLPSAVKVHNRAIFDDSATIIPTKSTRLVGSKRGSLSDVDFIDGKVLPEFETPTVPPSPITSKASLFDSFMPSTHPMIALSRKPSLQATAFTQPSNKLAAFSTTTTVQSPLAPPPSPSFTRPFSPEINLQSPLTYAFPPSTHQPSNSVFAHTSAFPRSVPSSQEVSLNTSPSFRDPALSPSRRPFFIPPGPHFETSPLQSPNTSKSIPSITAFSRKSSRSETTSPSSPITPSRRKSSILISSTPIPSSTLIEPSLELGQNPADPLFEHKEAEQERLVKEARAVLVESLAESTFDTMARSWMALEYRNILADQQRRRSLLRSMLDRWTGRLIGVVQAKDLADRGRVALREVLRRVQWTAGRQNVDTGRSGLKDPRRLRLPVVDEEYVQTLKEAGAKRAELWAKGSFLESLRARLRTLRRGYPPHWHIWLRTVSSSLQDPTAQWLRRKLDMEGCSLSAADLLDGLTIRSIDDNEMMVKPPTMDLTSPGLIVFEVTQTLGVSNTSDLGPTWLNEIIRLHHLLHAIPSGPGYDPVLLFMIWVPRDIEYEVFRTNVLSKMNDSLIDDHIKAHIHQSSVVLLSSATAADEGFASVIDKLTFDVTGHRGSSLSIEDIVEPFATAWRDALGRGMRHVSPGPNKISWRGYAILFQCMVLSLNQMIESVWELAFGRTGTNPVTLFPLPQFNLVNGVFGSDHLFSALLEYLASPPLRSYPAVEVFKAELRNHTYFAHDALLQSLLQRLMDTVVLEIILSTESVFASTGGIALAGQQATSASVALFKERLDESIRGLPVNDEVPPPIANGGNPDDGRKRPWKDDEESRVDAVAKRSRPASLPAKVAETTPIVTVSSLLQTIREARAKHDLPILNDRGISSKLS